MKWLRLPLVAAAAVLASLSAATTTKRCFPDNFLFGSATATAQIEGSWNETGRTPSIWDSYCRESDTVFPILCGNAADDFFHRFYDDIQLMVESGLDSFRFSISWSRAMNWDPQAKKMKANPPGIALYHVLIDELQRNDIVSIITLSHCDLPIELQLDAEPHGWLNPKIVDHFAEYADLVFTEFGSKVEFWSTFNEPLSFVQSAYGNGIYLYGLTNSTTNTYTAAHNVLPSHGKAVRRFHELKKSGVVQGKARVGIVLSYDYSLPLNASGSMDVAASDRKIHFGLGWFLTPIVSGKYPDIMCERVGDRLPEFTEEELAIVKGSYDLFMLNHYGTKAVTDCNSETPTVKCSELALGYDNDLRIDDTRATGSALVEYERPRRAQLQDPAAEILLTENGWCGNDTFDNPDLLWYYQTYIGEVHRAITEFQIPIIGYTVWPFMDNYEWGSYNPRFGLYYVNYTSETGSLDEVASGPTALPRTLKPPGKWYSQLAKTKCMDEIETGASNGSNDDGTVEPPPTTPASTPSTTVHPVC